LQNTPFALAFQGLFLGTFSFAVPFFFRASDRGPASEKRGNREGCRAKGAVEDEGYAACRLAGFRDLFCEAGILPELIS
jgi:hypothetical protein